MPLSHLPKAVDLQPYPLQIGKAGGNSGKIHMLYCTIGDKLLVWCRHHVSCTDSIIKVRLFYVYEKLNSASLQNPFVE